MRRFIWTSFALFIALMADYCRADNFGSGANSFTIDFVAIGNPGNPPDTTDLPVTYGAVPYKFRIGKYEVSEQMVQNANTLGALGIMIDARGLDKPATSVSWVEAAKFVNWLNTSTGNSPAYKFDAVGTFQLWLPSDPGYIAANRYRNRLAKFVLPSLNEWHKAAYYDPAVGTYFDYPNGSNSVPDGIDFPGDSVFDAVFFDGGSNGGPNNIADVGLLSPYGTAGQGGNVEEWEETAFDQTNDSSLEGRGFRGGDWGFGSTVLLAANRNGIGPLSEGVSFGFRVASIPEPSSQLLLAVAQFVLLRRFAPRPRTLSRRRLSALSINV